LDKNRTKTTRSERIIQAAVNLFLNTHNFSKVSIEEIAGKAGVSPTTIYNLFSNRENLTIEVIKKISMDNLNEYRNIIDSDKPYPEKIKLIMDIRMKSASMDVDMLDKLVSTDKTLIEFAEEINEKVSMPLLTDFIEDGRLQGYIRNDLSDESILAYLEILSKSGTIYYRFVELHRDDPNIIEQLNDLLFFGILDKGRV
jgi:AcrR family transcriptional regulator